VYTAILEGRKREGRSTYADFHQIFCPCFADFHQIFACVVPRVGVVRRSKGDVKRKLGGSKEEVRRK